MANIARIDPFDDLFRGFFVRPVDFNGAPAQPPSIKMDVKDQGDNYLIHAELPGVTKEDIHVTTGPDPWSSGLFLCTIRGDSTRSMP
jgi:HSP20 family protein